MLSRRHYNEFARSIRESLSNCYADEDRLIIRNLALSFMEFFKLDNPNFDQDKFMKACGLKSDG